MKENENRDLRDDEALWDLLGRARAVEVSPFFARKVLRAVEAKPSGRPVWVRWLRRLSPAAICAALALASMAGIFQSEPTTVAASDEAPEFETIASLDLLLANYESSIWREGIASSSRY